MPFGIVGVLKFGIFTPTEAGVAACVYAFVVGVVIYRELRWRKLLRLLVVGRQEHLDRRLPDRRGAGLGLADHDRPTCRRRSSPCSSRSWATRSLLMFVIMVLVVVVGTALDFAPTVMILTPVLMPVIKEAGIDPVYFGVLFIMNNAIGLITPPVGIVLNVICGVAKISMSELMQGPVAVPLGRAHRAVPAGPVPVAGHAAAEVADHLIPPRLQRRRRHP